MSGSPLILDASVVVKLALEEEYSETCEDLFMLDRPLWAPDLMPIEVGNILWKAVQRGRCSPLEAREALAKTHMAPIRVMETGPYQDRAMTLALAYGRSFYDALYLALAQMEGGIFVTADERMVNAMQGTPMAPYLHWIGAVTVLEA